MPADEPALLTLMKELVDALGTLVSGHLRLARAELGDDARRYARRASAIAIAALLLLLGYGLACVAAALSLAPLTGAPLAFLAVGGVHLAAGAAALARVLGRDARRPLDASLSALDRTVTALSAGADGALRPVRAAAIEDEAAGAAPALEGATP
jgi:hypothetical protein